MTNLPLIYVGPSPTTPEKQPSDYESGTAPYYTLKITYNLYAANQFTFESPNCYGDMSKVNVVYNGKTLFGGQIVETKETEAGYEYSCLDYTRLLFGKWPFHYTNVLISDVIKDTVEYVGMPTSGIVTSGQNWPKLGASNQKRINTCQQMANLEGYEFHVNVDGIPILQLPPEPTEGYLFATTSGASNYSIDYDDNDIVDAVYVLGDKSVLLYEYVDIGMIIKYGYLEDFISDTNLEADDISDAISQANSLFNNDNEARYAGTITIPDIIPITEGQWCIFIPPPWSKETKNAFYTKQVDITVDATTCNTEVQFLNGQPLPPDEWMYVDPLTGEQEPSAAMPDGYIYTYRPVWICSDNIYGPGPDQSHINTIMAGLRNMNITCYDGGIGPNTHDSLLESGKLQSNAMLIEIYGGVDAGVINEKSTSWWKSLLGKKKDALVFMDTAGVLITGLAWLPRAHDDNYDPPSFTGIPHPDQILADEGIPYKEGISPNNLEPVISFIQQISWLTKTPKAPKLPAELDGVDPSLTKYCQIYRWIDDNIVYSYYMGSKQTIQQTLAKGSANCVDQALLAAAWLNAEGYKTQQVKLTVTQADCDFNGPHEHLLVLVNNQWLVWDTVCHRLSQVTSC
jgi:hypothetical protein